MMEMKLETLRMMAPVHQFKLRRSLQSLYELAKVEQGAGTWGQGAEQTISSQELWEMERWVPELSASC